jgi:hypothetical protein
MKVVLAPRRSGRQRATRHIVASKDLAVLGHRPAHGQGLPWAAAGTSVALFAAASVLLQSYLHDIRAAPIRATPIATLSGWRDLNSRPP